MAGAFKLLLLLESFVSARSLNDRTLVAVSTDTDSCDRDATGMSLRQLRIARHQNQQLAQDTRSVIPALNLSDLAVVPDVDQPPTCWYFGEAGTQPNLTIVTNFAGLPEDVVSCTHQNRLSYAQSNGFEYCEFLGAFNVSGVGKSFSMQKWMSVNALLKEPTERGFKRQTVMWIDADALFTNLSISAFEIAEGYKSKDLIVTGDCLNDACRDGLDDLNLTNLGVFIARNTDWIENLTRTLFQKAASDDEISDRLTLEKLWYSFPEEFHEHMEVIHMKVMDSANYGWEPGDLVLHLPGASSGATKALKWLFFGQLCSVLHTFGQSAAEATLHTALQALGCNKSNK